MHSAPTLLVTLITLLASGCATVNPYPPVTREQQPDAKTVPLQTDEREVNADAVLVQHDAVVPEVEDLLALIDTGESPAAGIPQWADTQDEDFWHLVRSDFRHSDIRHKKIRRETARYAKHTQPVELTLKRGEPYLAYIRHEVEKRGFPGEVVLLPFVESGFDPFAYSHGRAAGLWQFIPSTGSYFGLKQDWWYDERRDIVASTDAALVYLDKLQKQFKGDWLLTFAAYNAGGGTVRNAIKRNRKAGKPTDFWNLELPDETTAYVPKLLAICRIVNNPGEYRIVLPDIDSTPGFAIIETGNQLDLEVAAELAGMETEDFQQINPGFNRWATHPDGPHQLAIPVDKADTFAKNLAELQASERIKWLRHRTAKGETLSHIAQRYRTTVKVLRQSNNLKSTRIRAGSHLLVPVAASDDYAYAELDEGPAHTGSSTGKISHQVLAGDSLWSIAHHYQVAVAQLKEWNQLGDSSVIRPGQQLVIWMNSNEVASGARVRTVNYAVRSGDSLYAISRKYNVSIKDLQGWNSLHENSYLQPGQKLTVHVDVTRLTKY